MIERISRRHNSDEYMHTAQSAQETPIENTLFIDAILDDLTDAYGSKEDAYKAMGLALPEKPHSDLPSVGASVELGVRAVSAVANIMDTYNQLNKLNGARQQRAKMSDSTINTRYSNPDEIIERMGQKASKRISGNKADFNFLNDTDGMIAAGFTPAEAAQYERDYKTDLLDRFGPGNANWEDRRKYNAKIEQGHKRRQAVERKNAS